MGTFLGKITDDSGKMLLNNMPPEGEPLSEKKSGKGIVSSYF